MPLLPRRPDCWIALAAEQGHAAAQNQLGSLYSLGEGVPEDHTEAVKWIRLAAEQGYSGALYNMGELYHEGKCVPQDDTEAVFQLYVVLRGITEKRTLSFGDFSHGFCG